MRKLIPVLAAAAMLMTAGPLAAQQGYELVDPPQPTDGGDKVEVIEFFWYGCPHCYSFLPYIEEWAASPPPNAVFRLEAPPLNPAWTLHSRAFYAAQVLGVLDEFHVPMFHALHRDRKSLNSIQAIADFAGTLGIDPKQFADTMTSFAVETKVRRANQMARNYRLGGVPAVAVAGKYMTNGSLAGGYEALIGVINRLVAQETAASN